MRSLIVKIFFLLLFCFTTSFKTAYLETKLTYVPKVGLKTGNIAPDIELYNLNGEIIKLSSLRGNIVLIDFWASWCKGCRVVNKRLRPIYKKFNKQKFINGDGFLIYSICLDTDSARWLNAIDKDSIHDFINVSDLKGFDSQVAKDYEITGFPTSYLIDGNGIILNKKGGLTSALERNMIKEN